MNRSEKLKQTGIKKFGSEVAWRAHLSASAKKASYDTPRGFAIIKQKNPKLFKELTSRGGKNKAKNRGKNKGK